MNISMQVLIHHACITHHTAIMHDAPHFKTDDANDVPPITRKS